MSFSKLVNSLYFGAEIHGSTDSLIEDFANIKHLRLEHRSRQSNLMTSIRMQTDNHAWSTRYLFKFTNSPLLDLKISSGWIEVEIGEAIGKKLLLDVKWRTDFDSDDSARAYFTRLQELFGSYATEIKHGDENGLEVFSQYSCADTFQDGVKDVTISLGRSLQSGKYEILLLIGNELVGQ